MARSFHDRLEGALHKYFYEEYAIHMYVEPAQAYLRNEKSCYSIGYDSNYEIARGGPYWAVIERHGEESPGTYACRCEDDVLCFLLAFIMSRQVKETGDEFWVCLSYNRNSNIWTLKANSVVVGHGDDPLSLLGIE